MEEYLGMIKLFAGNFAPRFYQMCWGQTLPISQYTALFSILGTYYGGNGTTTFQLPDLRGRFAIGMGSGLGLPPINIGEVGGNTQVSLLTTNLPSHSHTITGTVQVLTSAHRANSDTPGGNTLAVTTPNNTYITGAGAGTVPLAGASGNFTAGLTGGNVPVDIQPPYLGLNYIICVSGVFPSRN